MSPLVAFIVVFIIMMIALIKFKITPPAVSYTHLTLPTKA